VSGCCGSSPVVIQGPAPSRVDVETLLLCDVLADGTVAATVLVEPVYDTNTGQRIATRTVDPVTGSAYTVQGELQECPAPDTCSCQTVILCDLTEVTTPGETPERLTAGDFPDAAATNAAWTRTDGAGWVNPDGPDGVPGFLDFSGADTIPGSIEQTVTVTPGVSYAFSAHFGTWNGGGSHQQTGRIEIFDGAGTLLFTQDVAPTIGASGIIWPADGIVGPVNIVATDDTMRLLITDTSVNPGQTDLIVDNVSLLGPGVPGETTTTAVPFLRTICRTCSGTATVTDTTLDGTTTYDVQGVVGVCGPTESPATDDDCDQFVGTLCYQEPSAQTPSFTLHKFNDADPNHPGCLVGLDAMDGDFPAIQYNDPITAWEGTYSSNTGTASNVEVSAPELGGFIDWSAFSPAIPSVPADPVHGHRGDQRRHGHAGSPHRVGDHHRYPVPADGRHRALQAVVLVAGDHAVRHPGLRRPGRRQLRAFLRRGRDRCRHRGW
jgi:hypothetical protein